MNKIKHLYFLIILLAACGANVAPTPVVPTGTPIPPKGTPVPAIDTPIPSSPAAIQGNRLTLTLAPGVTLELVRVPAGQFLMGSADSETDAISAAQPQSKTPLDEYWISKYDVTNAQFAAFVQATGYKTTAEQRGSSYVKDGISWKSTPGANWQHPRGPNSTISGKDNYAVVQISWDDAVAFCAWASKTTGRQIKLPSEAQWEKAARGTDDRLYPWGNQAPDATRLNFNGNVGDTTEVGKYSPLGDSPYGAVDMAGNVWQWTSSLYKPYPYNATDGREDASSREGRVFRGGGFHDVGARYVRSAYRDANTPDDRADDRGFRVVAYATP